MGPGHTPFARAIGMTLTGDGQGTASARLAWSAANAVSAGDGRIHPLALAGLLDEVSGRALATSVAAGMGMSTLELRIDFTGRKAAGDVLAQAHCEDGPGGDGRGADGPHEGAPDEVRRGGDGRGGVGQGSARLIRGTACDEAGAMLAGSVAWFALGAFPGEARKAAVAPGGVADDAAPAPGCMQGAAGPFEALCGLERRPASAVLAPGTPAVVGYVGLPAVHGGVVAALLAVACEQCVAGMGGAGMRLASLSVRFLRAAGMQGLEATAACPRVGRQIAHATALCRHGAGPVVAEANAAFVRQG